MLSVAHINGRNLIQCKCRKRGMLILSWKGDVKSAKRDVRLRQSFYLMHNDFIVIGFIIIFLYFIILCNILQFVIVWLIWSQIISRISFNRKNYRELISRCFWFMFIECFFFASIFLSVKKILTRDKIGVIPRSRSLICRGSYITSRAIAN